MYVGRLVGLGFDGAVFKTLTNREQRQLPGDLPTCCSEQRALAGASFGKCQALGGVLPEVPLAKRTVQPCATTIVIFVVRPPCFSTGRFAGGH